LIRNAIAPETSKSETTDKVVFASYNKRNVATNDLPQREAFQILLNFFFCDQSVGVVQFSVKNL